MPLYTYKCSGCGTEEDVHACVAARDAASWKCGCGGQYARKFVATVQVLIPARFGVERGWHLPDTREGWEGVGTLADRSIVHSPDDGMAGYHRAIEEAVQGI